MAAQLIGIAVFVTLKDSQHTVVQGRVANVVEQTATLVLQDGASRLRRARRQKTKKKLTLPHSLLPGHWPPPTWLHHRRRSHRRHLSPAAAIRRLHAHLPSEPPARLPASPAAHSPHPCSIWSPPSSRRPACRSPRRGSGPPCACCGTPEAEANLRGPRHPELWEAACRCQPDCRGAHHTHETRARGGCEEGVYRRQERAA